MKKAGDLLGAFFDERMMRTAHGYSELFGAWKSIVGEKIAAHSRIAELDKSILLVEADHPGWIQILQTKQAVILDGVQKRFPQLSIVGISIRLAKEGFRSTSAGEATGEPRIRHPQGQAVDKEEETSPDEEKAAADADPYAKISDPAFKELLVRLEKSIKGRNKPR